MQKLAPGTEGTITLAGALESLEKPVAGLVRLTQATMMPALDWLQANAGHLGTAATPGLFLVLKKPDGCAPGHWPAGAAAAAAVPHGGR